MSTREIACPACGTTLQLNAAIPAGGKVRCRRCAFVFSLWSKPAPDGAVGIADDAPAVPKLPDHAISADAPPPRPPSAVPAKQVTGITTAAATAAPPAFLSCTSPAVLQLSAAFAETAFGSWFLQSLPGRALTAYPRVVAAGVLSVLCIGVGLCFMRLYGSAEFKALRRLQTEKRWMDRKSEEHRAAEERRRAAPPAEMPPPKPSLYNEMLPRPIAEEKNIGNRSPLRPVVFQTSPRDLEAQQQRYQDLYTWNVRTLADAYERNGKKHARWDKAAKQALDALARFISRQLPAPALTESYAAAKDAVDAGCDDPLILYVYARSSYAPNYPGKDELARRCMTAAHGMAHSSYAPFRRLIALSAAAASLVERDEQTPETRKQAERMLTTALDQLAVSSEQDEHSANLENVWIEQVQSIFASYRKLIDGWREAFDQVDVRLARVPALKVIRLKFRADFLIDWAWEARGRQSGFEAGDKCQERLQDAGKALDQAWKMQPNDSWIATRMLLVQFHSGSHYKDMERWFDRAMRGDPVHHFDACLLKVDWLSPRWHGCRLDVLAFARECRATKNWYAGITLLVARAHHSVSTSLPGSRAKAYMQTPEVWEEIKAVYEVYLGHFPHDHVQRSNYAAYCYLCGQFIEAHKQFEVLGDDCLCWSAPFDEKWMKEARAQTVTSIEK